VTCCEPVAGEARNKKTIVVKQSPGIQRKKKIVGPDSNWDKAPMPENTGTSKKKN
jgi:hypothetical protein